MRKSILTSFIVPLLAVFLLLISSFAFGQANGKLQIHFIDVGQGDAAVLISPKGEVVMFDDGVAKHCDLPVSYLQKLGISKIDFYIASHYHDDHIGCTSEVLKSFPLQKAAYDRGHSVSTNVFRKYIKAVGEFRRTAYPGEGIILDTETANPVIIDFVAVNGAGVQTDNENDLSLVAVIRHGKLGVVIGGDLSGYDKGGYKDIESVIADKVGQVEVYKVHHHCSRYSSNDKWLSTIKPKIGIISASGTIGRNHNHPTKECLDRLHKYNIETYWTEEGGAAPDPKWDKVIGSVLVEYTPDGNSFTVSSNGSVIETYPLRNGGMESTSQFQTYIWSRNSNIYHYSGCRDAKKIKKENMEAGNTPPKGRHLHKECPK